MCSWFLILLGLCTETIKKGKNYQPEINSSQSCWKYQEKCKQQNHSVQDISRINLDTQPDKMNS